ncbi:TPA: helix-turn-helix domain-containing protein [Enterococcus faecium]
MNGGENVARKKYPEAVETGQRIRLARIEKGLSMEQLGGKLSPPASKGAVSNWENGYNLPNNTRLKQLSKVLDVSTTYLLNGSYTLRDMHMMPEIKRNVLEKQLKKTIKKNNSIIDSNLSNAINNIEEDNLTVSQKIYLTNAIKYLKTGSRIEFPDGSTPIAYLAALLNTLLRYDSLINDSEKNTDEKKEYQEFYENDLLKEFTALVTELNKHYSK